MEIVELLADDRQAELVTDIFAGKAVRPGRITARLERTATGTENDCFGVKGHHRTAGYVDPHGPDHPAVVFDNFGDHGPFDDLNPALIEASLNFLRRSNLSNLSR